MDRSGFGVFLNVPTEMKDWDDSAEIIKSYYPETINFLKRKLGASEVHIFDHTIRKREPEKDKVEDKPGNRQPVFRVHVDQTPISGEYRVQAIVGEARASEVLRKRVQIINVWRPLRGPIQDSPVGFIDSRTIDWDKDMAIGEIYYRDRTGYTYLVHHNPDHQWFYLSEMMPDETLLIKCYDNRLPQTIAAHSGFAFDNPPAGYLPRQSIELRALVIYDDP